MKAVKIKELIAQHQDMTRGMGDMAGVDGWDESVKRLNKIEQLILAYQCNTAAQFRAWYQYVHFVPAISRKITPQAIADQVQRVKEADIARRPTGRTFDNPQTTYEIGILGSDRIPVVEPRPGSKTKYHRKYPLEVMEIGEQILVPGMKDRTGMAGTLAAAQRRYKRRFKTEAVAGGLLVTRVE